MQHCSVCNTESVLEGTSCHEPVVNAGAWSSFGCSSELQILQFDFLLFPRTSETYDLLISLKGELGDPYLRT